MPPRQQLGWVGAGALCALLRLLLAGRHPVFFFCPCLLGVASANLNCAWRGKIRWFYAAAMNFKNSVPSARARVRACCGTGPFPHAGPALNPGAWSAGRGSGHGSYLVDPASSHMLVSKIKPCMSKYKQLYSETANGSLNQLSFI